MNSNAARPTPLANLSNTPVSISANRCELQTITARNPHATDGAYVKIYETLTSGAAPTGVSTPVWAGWVAGASSQVFPLFISGAGLYIAVATEFGAGLSAPSSAFQVSITVGKS